MAKTLSTLKKLFGYRERSAGHQLQQAQVQLTQAEGQLDSLKALSRQYAGDYTSQLSGLTGDEIRRWQKFLGSLKAAREQQSGRVQAGTDTQERAMAAWRAQFVRRKGIDVVSKKREAYERLEDKRRERRLARTTTRSDH